MVQEFEQIIKDYMTTRLKDDSFHEIHTYWKTIKEKGDLDESRGLKSKDNEKINETVTVECKRLNLGLMSTFCSLLWGSLQFINRVVPVADIGCLSLLNTFVSAR